MTTHAHVISRCCIALSLLAYVGLVTRREDEAFWPRAFLLGVATGLGFLARPAEVGSLMALPAVHLLWRAARGERDGTATVLAALAGVLGPILVFGFYNEALTGNYFLEPRRAAGANIDAITRPDTPIWARFGGHGAFNLWMLAVWFLGPLGLPLAWLGASRRRVTSCVLMASVFAALSVTLLHDNVGIHMVGPIHYSESSVPLALLALLGAERLTGLARAHRFQGALPTIMVAGYCTLAMGLFLQHYGGELRSQANFQALSFQALEEADVHNAVVLGLDPALIDTTRTQEMASSWVLKFPHPDPELRDDVIFARPSADLEALRRRFPTRSFYRLVYHAEGEPVETQWLAGPTETSRDRVSQVR